MSDRLVVKDIRPEAERDKLWSLVQVRPVNNRMVRCAVRGADNRDEAMLVLLLFMVNREDPGFAFPMLSEELKFCS